jgi:hypothetical protein
MGALEDDETSATLIETVGISLLICIAIAPPIFGLDAAVPMMCVTAAFGLAVLCRLVSEGMREERSRRQG